MKNFAKKRLLAILGLVALFLITGGQIASAYDVEVILPGMTSRSVTDPGVYIRYLFIFGLSLAGFLAVAAIALGGIQYMAAGTSMTSLEKGKEMIRGAVLGIILLLCSYLILYTIDPSLTNLSPSIPPATQVAPPPPTPTICPTTPCSPAVYVRNEQCECVPDTSLN